MVRHHITLLFSTALISVSVTLPVWAENLDHIRQLLSTKSCPGCDLVGAGLTYSDLRGANLKGANLQGVNLSRANLMGADLSGADLRGASLNGAMLQGTNFMGANLSGADLRDAYLAGADFRNVEALGTLLKGAIGIPVTIATATDYHNWGVEEGIRGNYRGAVDYFSQALALEPRRSTTALSRSIARLRLNDLSGAMADAQRASALFKEEGNIQSYEVSQTLIQEIERAKQGPETPGTGIGAQIINGLGSLLPLLF